MSHTKLIIKEATRKSVLVHSMNRPSPRRSYRSKYASEYVVARAAPPANDGHA